MSPQQRLSVAIIGDPQLAGSITGNLHIVSSDPMRPIRDIPLGGQTLVPPAARTSTPGLSFGQVHVFRAAGQNVSLPLRLSNAGGSGLEGTGIGFGAGSSPDYAVNPTAIGGAIVPGDGVDLTVSYAPTTVGPDTAMLVITTNDPLLARVEVPISGEGIDPTIFLFKSSVAPIPASPIVFGSVYRQATPAPITLTIQNTGVGPLVLESLALTAGSSGDYTLSGLPALFLIERNQPEKRAKNASLRDEKGKSTTTTSISGSKTTFRDA